MKIRQPQREYVEAYSAEVSRVVEAIRIARGSKPEWQPMVTDNSQVADFFSDRQNWRDLMQTVGESLGVCTSGTVVDVAKRLRGKQWASQISVRNAVNCCKMANAHCAATRSTPAKLSMAKSTRRPTRERPGPNDMDYPSACVMTRGDEAGAKAKHRLSPRRVPERRVSLFNRGRTVRTYRTSC